MGATCPSQMRHQAFPMCRLPFREWRNILVQRMLFLLRNVDKQGRYFHAPHDGKVISSWQPFSPLLIHKRATANSRKYARNDSRNVGGTRANMPSQIRPPRAKRSQPLAPTFPVTVGTSAEVRGWIRASRSATEHATTREKKRRRCSSSQSHSLLEWGKTPYSACCGVS